MTNALKMSITWLALFVAGFLIAMFVWHRPGDHPPEWFWAMEALFVALSVSAGIIHLWIYGDDW